MNTKLLLIAASTLAIAACGGSDVEVAETNEDGAEVLLSEEQPQLEGDSPFVDGEDVADSTLDQESYDTGFDGPDLTDEGYRTDTVAGLDGDALGPDMDEGVDTTGFGTATDNLITESQRIASEADRGVRTAADDMRDGARDMASDTRRAASDAAQTVTDGISAKRYTANNTDAYIGDDGELITGSEAALLAGTYDVALPGQTGTKTLYVTGEGDKAVGTFDGEPIEVMVTGRNFSFDAPVMMDGTEELMTFAGTFEDGMIDNGVLESQGDGMTMTFTAVRTDANTTVGARGMVDDASDATSGAMDGMRRTGDRMMDDGEGLLDETGDAIGGAYDSTTNAVGDAYDETTETVGSAYDRATDGSDRTNALGTDRGDGDVDLDIDEDLDDADMDMNDDPNFDM